MDRYFSGDAQVVAEAMLTDSHAFLIELCNWVTRKYSELLMRTESNAETVWSLVAHDIRVIFQMLYEVRGPGRNTEEPEHFFWGTVRAHKVMQDLRDHSFSGHPMLGQALNQHLQDNSVMKSTFKVLETHVKNMQKEVIKAKRVADKALAAKKDQRIGKWPVSLDGRGVKKEQRAAHRSGGERDTLLGMVNSDIGSSFVDLDSGRGQRSGWQAQVRPIEDKGWILGNTRYNHAQLGGLTNLESISRMAWRKECYDGNKAFIPDPT
eukprot:scaffold45488_cov40-Attheya_sp.AAC.2